MGRAPRFKLSGYEFKSDFVSLGVAPQSYVPGLSYVGMFIAEQCVNVTTIHTYRRHVDPKSRT